MMMKHVMWMMAVGALALGACGSGEAEEDTRLPGEGYVVSMSFFSPEGTTGYIGVVGDLDPSVEVDVTSNGIEVPGGANIWATPDGALLVFELESRRLERFRAEGGRLVPDGEISLQNEATGGVYGGHLVFGEPGQAFLNFAGSDQRIVEVDYGAMAIGRTFELPAVGRDGWEIVTGYDTVYADGRLYFAVGWAQWENRRSFTSVGLVVVDVDTGEVTVDESEGCHSLEQLVVADDGYIYGASAYYPIWMYSSHGEGVNSCARRVRVGETAWDDSYAPDLDSLVVGKSPWAAGVSGRGGHMWMASIQPDFDPAGLEYGVINVRWLWERVNLANPNEPVVTSDRPVVGADVITSVVDGRTFIMEVGDDNATTTLLDASGDELREFARFRGYMTGFVRLAQ